MTTHGAMKTSSSTRRGGGHVRVRLDLRPGADRGVVLDHCAPTDDHLVAELASLADARLVAHDHTLPEPASGEDDGAGEDRCPVPDDERREPLAARR